VKEYTIAIRPDDVDKKFSMVCIFDDKDRLVGIPARGLTKKEAQKMLRPLLYSFRYGTTEMRNTIYQSGSINIEEKS
jgi:hypothetical protein